MADEIAVGLYRTADEFGEVYQYGKLVPYSKSNSRYLDSLSSVCEMMKDYLYKKSDFKKGHGHKVEYMGARVDHNLMASRVNSFNEMDVDFMDTCGYWVGEFEDEILELMKRGPFRKLKHNLCVDMFNACPGDKEMPEWSNKKGVAPQFGFKRPERPDLAKGPPRDVPDWGDDDKNDL